MSCTGSKTRRILFFCLGLAVILASAALPAAAVCLANGKPCGAPITANDRLCCPGSICGPWGNICQPGCRINGTAYRAGQFNPSNPCQVCQPNLTTTAWSAAPNGTSCSDGNRCTQTDTCQAGSCVGSNSVACTPSNQCHLAGTCNPATGVCSNPSKPDGTACNDYNACTLGDTCQGGSCTSGTPLLCPPPDQCHEPGICDRATGQCLYLPTPDGVPCDDQQLCTGNDACHGGICSGDPVSCAADPCTDPCHLAGNCDPATGHCVKPSAPNGTPCSDGDICTLDACVNGACTPQAPNPAHDHCSDGTQDCGELGVDCGGSCPNFCPAAFCPSPCSPSHCTATDICGFTGPIGVCVCSQTTEGVCFCAEIDSCGSIPDCSSSADCPAGTQCMADTCCNGGGAKCLQPCGARPFTQAAVPGRGLTTHKVN